jgi:glucosylceramidase
MQFFLQNLAPKAQRTALRTLLMTVLGGFGLATSVSNAIASPTPEAKLPLSMWLTTGDQQQLLQRDVGSLLQPFQATAPTIELNSAERHQQMDGFGYTLTGGSAIHLMSMSAPARAALLRELFTSQGIGVSYLRVSLGASDLDPDPFSYADVPAGETDVALKSFTLKRDEAYLIPLLKEILQLQPQLKILASPWSPPAWMKNNRNTVGGELLEQYYPAYANYFVKYIQGMQQHGIRIDAVTVQNEPLNERNNPSLLMHAWDQAAFVKNQLGPAFKAAGIRSKIIIYDHNPDHVEYPLAVLNDTKAKAFIDGTAFHLYNGSIDELAKLRAAHPDKHIYFTEQWVGAKSDFNGTLMWHIEQLIIGATRNYAKNVLEWNLAADAAHRPFTEGGCFQCLGALTITGDQVQRNVAYYVIAHAGKAVPAGSWHIESTQPAPLKTVAFLRPDGQRVLIVLNNNDSKQLFNLPQQVQQSYQLPAHSVLTVLLPQA